MTAPYWADHDVTLHRGDAEAVLAELPAESAQCVVTSPPYYGLRDYGDPAQLGLEPTPARYVERLVDVFAAARRVLARDGVLWLNIGDSYSGSWGNQSRGVDSPGMASATDGRYPAGTRTGAIRPGSPPAKNLLGVPWRVAFALQDDGWILRNAVVWNKPNAMPESVTDRLSCRYELVFLLTRSRRYRFDLDPIRVPLVAEPNGSIIGGARGGEGKVGASWRRTGGMPNTWGDPDEMTPSTRAASRRSRTGHRNKPNTAPAPWDADTARGRNPGDVWTIPTTPYPGAHFATFPAELARRCILAGARAGDVVLDPFTGSGTTGKVARQLGRRFVGIDLRAEYLDLAVERIGDPVLEFPLEPEPARPAELDPADQLDLES